MIVPTLKPTPIASGMVCGIVSLIGVRNHGPPLFGILGTVLNGLTKLRNLDSDIGRALLEMFDLLETNWGNWECDRDTGQLTSNDAQFREDYNRLLQRIKDAHHEAVETQRRLLL